MERDRGRGLKQQQPAWTPGHNFSLAAGCFSWQPLSQRSPPPSSSYTCGYCRREFRSAQALGGHMNVHRRDRARLRQCCSVYPSNPNLIAADHRAASPLIPNLNFLPPHHCAATAAEPVVHSFLSTTTPAMKAAVVEVNLDMGMGGVCRSSGAAAEHGAGLDLELRLGCSWE